MEALPGFQVVVISRSNSCLHSSPSGIQTHSLCFHGVPWGGRGPYDLQEIQEHQEFQAAGFFCDSLAHFSKLNVTSRQEAKARVPLYPHPQSLARHSVRWRSSTTIEWMDMWTSQVVYSILESTDLERPPTPSRKLLEVSDGSVLTWFFTYSSWRY